MLKRDRRLSLFIIGIMLVLNVIVSVCLYIAVVNYSTEIEFVTSTISDYTIRFINWILGWFGMEI